ncbi:hypothetical protein BHM03_00019401 [Ensete ventricosum]|nr:hypothetical protein BHM03_00019401 [Ensete ventricosum]
MWTDTSGPSGAGVRFSELFGGKRWREVVHEIGSFIRTRVARTRLAAGPWKGAGHVAFAQPRGRAYPLRRMTRENTFLTHETLPGFPSTASMEEPRWGVNLGPAMGTHRSERVREAGFGQ